MSSRKIVVGAAGLALAASGGAAAVSASGSSDSAESAATNLAVVKQKHTFEMRRNRFIKDGLRFDKDVYAVNSGGTLRVVNNKASEGPHTVSIVKKGDRPDNIQEVFNCEVCNAMFEAHGATDDDKPPRFPFVEDGKGQKDPSNFNRPGDSGVTGPQKGDSFEVPVTAPAGSTRWFVCAVHPWMQAKLRVE
jgi:hypothetical protein